MIYYCMMFKPGSKLKPFLYYSNSWSIIMPKMDDFDTFFVLACTKIIVFAHDKYT